MRIPGLSAIRPFARRDRCALAPFTRLLLYVMTLLLTAAARLGTADPAAAHLSRMLVIAAIATGAAGIALCVMLVLLRPSWLHTEGFLLQLAAKEAGRTARDLRTGADSVMPVAPRPPIA